MWGGWRGHLEWGAGEGKARGWEAQIRDYVPGMSAPEEEEVESEMSDTVNGRGAREPDGDMPATPLGVRTIEWDAAAME